MSTKRRARLTEVIKEIETLVKRLRAELRSAVRKSGLTKNLQQAAAALRKQAALLAAQVEKYVHELRTELARGMAVKRPASRRRRAA